MKISTKAWLDYINKMSKISNTAADLMQKWIQKNGFTNDKALLDYAYALSAHYGEAIAELSCQMYEATARAQKASIPSAEPAEVPEYGEVAKAVHGTMKQSQSLVPSTIGRLVKQVGADTTLKNAIRDGAEFAWVPHGDTCAFCITLASRGWQKVSKNTLRKGHAEHIHANCDCQYAVRFDGSSTVEGYDPDEYLKMYESAEGSTPQEKINSLRRMLRTDDSKKKSYEDITKNFNGKSTPGKGNIIFEKGTEKNDQDTVQWLYSTFGGDITCLAEKPQIGKMPDAIWDGIYWEFKAPTSKNAINDRIRKAQKQLYETLEREGKQDEKRGIVIDIGGCEIDHEEAVNEIINRVIARRKGPTDVIIKNYDTLIKVLRVK